MFPLGRFENTPMEDRMTRQLQFKLKQTPNKLILVLLETNHDLTNTALTENKCPVTNCLFTDDTSLLEKIDAVVFGHTLKSQIEPPQNRSHQTWVYCNFESPQYNNEEIHQKVNWTATYRADSVIVSPYAKFLPFKNYTDLPAISPINYAKGKTKMAAIFVSNCHVFNGRLAYLRELKKYVKVDIYGDCGNLRCTRNSSKSCFEMLKREYKFYLAFENSNCRDYITEKFFVNALR